jgi:omega-amidase
MSALNLCLIQTHTHWHDPAANRDLFADYFEDVADDCDLVVLPEMFSTGFTMEPEAVAEPMDGPTLTWLIDMAAQLDAVICGSLVIVEDGRYYNRFVWVRPNGEVSHYDKRHLFRMSGEHEHYAAGQTRLIVELNGWRIMPFVCYDLRFPVWLRYRNDYDVLLGVANWPAARQQHWETLLQARAIENLSFVVGVNRVGHDDNDVQYDGGSLIIDPQGRVQWQAGATQCVHAMSLDPAQLTGWRDSFPAWQDADPFRIG